mgnify:CR=1 FL=1
MKKFTKSQKEIITDFLTMIAAGWFGAGVITTAFVRPVVLLDTILNIVIGAALTYFSLRFAIYLERK